MLRITTPGVVIQHGGLNVRKLDSNPDINKAETHPKIPWLRTIMEAKNAKVHHAYIHTKIAKRSLLT